jgi:hypothetical protein
MNDYSNLDPNLRQFLEWLDKLKSELSKEDYDHALQDLRDSIEQRLPKKKKFWFW